MKLVAPDSRPSSATMSASGHLVPPVATIVVVATNELHHLRDCLPSLALLDGPPMEVIVVDNASTDQTGTEINTAYPWVRVVRTNERLGYAAANNLGFQHARGDYLIVLNPDTRVDPAFVRELVETSHSRGDQALVTSRICMFDDPETLNAAGNVVHFSMIAACRLLGEPFDHGANRVEVPSVSGCAFLIPRRILDDMGPFDNEVVPYLEDTDLSLRAWLRGYACVTAPDSVVFHKYRIRLQPTKFFHIERNRWLVMLRVFRFPTLVVLLPALVLIELMAWIYAVRSSRAHSAAKVRSYFAVLRLLPTALRGRRRVQALRRIGDRALLARLEAALPIQQLAVDVRAPQLPIRVINVLLTIYYGLVRRIVWW